MTDRVWLFDPTTANWSMRAPAFASMAGHTAIYDPSTNWIVVYAAGKTLLYDPAADIWQDMTPVE